jgi:hypothetical protein
MGSRILRRTGTAGLVACATAIVLASTAGVAGHSTVAVARPLGMGPLQGLQATNPTPTSTCTVTRGIRCYSPAQFEKAYDLAGLHGAGIDGSGETIAIVDSFGSPTIANDLHQFDQTFGVANAYGIPIDPAIATDPTLTVIQPAGAVPAFDATNSDMVGWAQETSLDVEWAHVFAPKAKILLVETPVSETEGVTGFPEIVKAENYVIDNHLATVISQSFGATEETFPHTQIPPDLRSAFQNAQRNGVTVLGASGDEGSTDFESNAQDLYPMQVNSWPSSDPLVTSVGGTQANLDDSGNRLTPDVVWNDSAIGIQAAGGGGVSAIFNRPDFQNGVKSVVGHSRGTPDISMNAAVDGGVWVYYTFVTPTSPWHIFGGTSAASPEFSGVVAMADQVAGQGLGVINNALYAMSYGGGLVDVTMGNNGIGPFQNSDGNTYDVPGFTAGPGYDLASGLGTVDAGRFVPALATAAGCSGGPDGPHGPGGPGGPGGPCGKGGDLNCNAALSFASVHGDVHVLRGASCSLTDSAVGGDVNVEPGGTLTLNGSTINGGVHSQGGAVTIGQDASGGPTVVGNDVEIANEPAGVSNVVCGSTINGNLDVHNNKSASTIGVSTGTCSAGNSVGGDVHVHDNSVAGASPSAVIAGNTIGHNLDCTKNTPAPAGSGNTVAGHKSGQCSGF